MSFNSSCVALSHPSDSCASALWWAKLSYKLKGWAGRNSGHVSAGVCRPSSFLLKERKTKILATYLWHGSGVTMTSWDKSQLPLPTAWDWDKFLVSMTCRDLSWLVLSCLFWFDSAADPGEASPLPYFSTKMTPEGSKKIFGDRPPPPLILGSGWPPPPPPYLMLWIRYCD